MSSDEPWRVPDEVIAEIRGRFAGTASRKHVRVLLQGVIVVIRV